MNIPIDVGPRQNGKTTRLLAWLAEDPDHRTVLCATNDMARWLYWKARKDYPNVEWLSALHFATPGLGRNMLGRSREVAIDQGDIVLKHLIGPGNTLASVTWTADEETP